MADIDNSVALKVKSSDDSVKNALDAVSKLAYLKQPTERPAQAFQQSATAFAPPPDDAPEASPPVVETLPMPRPRPAAADVAPAAPSGPITNREQSPSEYIGSHWPY